jgi:hypothetical protein
LRGRIGLRLGRDHPTDQGADPKANQGTRNGAAVPAAFVMPLVVAPTTAVVPPIRMGSRCGQQSCRNRGCDQQ